jgi:glycosyltransferase involved in cell wall biosynthesis
VVFLHVPDSAFGAVRMGYGRLRDQMAAQGQSLDIVTPEQFSWITRVHGRWIVLLYPFAVAWRLWRQRGGYDVALFHSYAGWVAHLLGVAPAALTVFHGVEPLHFRDLAEAYRARGARLSRRFRFAHGWCMDVVLRFSCRRSARVTCLNQEEYEFLLTEQWARPNQLVLLRHGVPDQFFVEGRVYAPRVRRLLFVSQWLERKGIDTLVEAFRQALCIEPSLELWCVGTRASDTIVRGAFPADIRTHVVNHPEVTQEALSVLVREADLFVHLAVNEAYGRAIAEAMAGALPIICTPVGVTNDLLRHGESVLVVPKGDPSAVAAAIETLLANPARRATLGRAAQLAAAPLRAHERDAVVSALIADVARTAA